MDLTPAPIPIPSPTTPTHGLTNGEIIIICLQTAQMFFTFLSNIKANKFSCSIKDWFSIRDDVEMQGSPNDPPSQTDS